MLENRKKMDGLSVRTIKKMQNEIKILQPIFENVEFLHFSINRISQ